MDDYVRDLPFQKERLMCANVRINVANSVAIVLWEISDMTNCIIMHTSYEDGKEDLTRLCSRHGACRSALTGTLEVIRVKRVKASRQARHAAELWR